MKKLQAQTGFYPSVPVLRTVHIISSSFTQILGRLRCPVGTVDFGSCEFLKN